MTPEQIEKLRAQADAYAAQELPFVHPLSMRFAQIRDTEFARLVAADTWERADSFDGRSAISTATIRNGFTGATACRNAIKAALRAAAEKEPSP